jgi:hypothetical protein
MVYSLFQNTPVRIVTSYRLDDEGSIPGRFSPEDGSNMYLRNVGIYLQSPHGITTQNNNIDFFNAARTANLI